MKNILLIGVGGTGSKAADIFSQKLSAEDRKHVKVLVFDTDESDIKKIEGAIPVKMADNASVGTVCDRIGNQYLREWFPCDDNNVRAQEMVRGASQWRKKSYLAFLNLMQKPGRRAAFIGALEEMAVDPSAVCEVYVVSSLAGGTGSGSFIPIALYAKRYLREKMGKNPIVNAMLALPDIYADSQSPDNRVKIFANAYAILRELNAINLVGRGYNRGRTTKKKAPISIKIGNADEPWVGLLFDSSDERFWTPEATPFTQVFLLDRIPKYSIPAHETVLANSLYTMLCTETGAEIESVLSNQETALSQNNGANAVYAGFATSQMRFPTDTILDYLAYSRAVESCSDSWTLLYRDTESKLQELQQREKEQGRRYVMSDGEYAKLYLEAYKKALDSNAPIVEIIERGTLNFDAEHHSFDRVELYMKELDRQISAALNSQAMSDFLDETFISAGMASKSFDPFDKAKGRDQRDRVVEVYEASMNKLNATYKEFVSSIRTCASSFSEGAISFDESKRAAYADSKLSIERQLLMKDRSYVHPIAAMVLLCKLKDKLTAKLKTWDEKRKWDCLNKRDVGNMPAELMNVDAASGKGKYVSLGESRLVDFRDEAEGDYCDPKKVKTNAVEDWKQMYNDFTNVLASLTEESKEQLTALVYKRLSDSVDLLIEKYRTFFNRFEKEKLVLESEMKTVLVRNSGMRDSIINVYASEKDKMAIAKQIEKNGGPATEEELIETDNICGSGVYESVYHAAVAAKEQDKEYNEKDSSTYRNLFNGLVAAYRKYIGKSDAFEVVQSYDVIQAIVESCGGKTAQQSAITAELGRVFEQALSMAKSPLRLDEQSAEIKPVDVTVFMLSWDTGRYIKQNADLLGLTVPADQVTEKKAIEVCTANFLEKITGIPGSRVIISRSLKGNVMYCTGETMNITPLCVRKINEVTGDDAVYYLYYKEAVKNAELYNTDMWNPHLGFDWEKRGHLPFMNGQMEQNCDDKMVKALLYALAKKEIVQQKSGTAKQLYNFRRKVNGGYEALKIDGMPIDNDNIAMLLHWMRDLDEELLNEWSTAFDKEITLQKDKLKSVISGSDNEIRDLKDSISRCDFMRWMLISLYEDPTYGPNDFVPADNTDKAAKKSGPSIPEFAYMVKASEEASGQDCDDAERILKVAYDVFMDMCKYRLPLDSRSDEFIRVYKHELAKIFTCFAGSRVVTRAGESCKEFFATFVNWVNGSGYFRSINSEKPYDDHGDIVIGDTFDLTKAEKDIGDTEKTAGAKNIAQIFQSIRNKSKRGGSADKDTADASDAAEEAAPAEETPAEDIPDEAAAPEENQ